jgi:hypothetical protein
MRERLFLYLLRKFSKTERQRLIILKEMWAGVLREYNEQTYTGNVYNFQIEFIMSNDYIKMLSASEDEKTLDRIRASVIEGTIAGIEILNRENLKMTEDQIRELIKYKVI